MSGSATVSAHAYRMCEPSEPPSQWQFVQWYARKFLDESYQGLVRRRMNY